MLVTPAVRPEPYDCPYFIHLGRITDPSLECLRLFAEAKTWVLVMTGIHRR
jgi:hypothetical protein